jgi:uncharacterized protein (TIGR04255 family)
MTNAANLTNEFKPLHEAHAIERVLFVIQFQSPLSNDEFTKLLDIKDTLKADLPIQTDIKSLTLSFNATDPTESTQSETPSGFLLQSLAKDGSIESELRVEPAAVIYRTDKYTRWDEVWLEAKKYLDLMVPIYTSSVSIKAISLNFTDKFIWNGADSNCDPKVVLKTDSDYLCPHIFSSSNLWHSHTGVFIRDDEKTKRLVNVNVECIDEHREINEGGTRRAIAILTIVTDNFDQDGYEKTDIIPEGHINFIDEHMQSLHVYGKKIFSNIVNDEMCKRINLVP